MLTHAASLGARLALADSVRFLRHLAFASIAGLIPALASSCSSSSTQAGADHDPAGGSSAPPGHGGGEVVGQDARPPNGDPPVELAPFHVIGRVDNRDPAGPRFAWPATEIRARFTGMGLSLVLADTGVSQYDVSIDGAAPTLLVVTGDAHTYDVASGLAKGVHDITVTKRTESLLGVTQLLGVLPAEGGALVPTPGWSGRRIELVGDSITCGYGVLGTSASCTFSAETEDEPLAWGGLAAKALSAAHMVTAVSGIGVLRNYGGQATETMPDRYGRALADDPSSTWDGDAFVPDAVVVNLGTNDFSGDNPDPGPAFETAYTAFLATLRAKHAGAWIVAATSPMLTEPSHTQLRAYVEGAIKARAAAGDSRISLLDIDAQLESDGYGCDWHPNTTTQRKMAARLVAHLHEHIAW